MGKTRQHGPPRGVDPSSLKHGGYDRSKIGSAPVCRKGGAGGKGNWGKPGDEITEDPVSRSDPNYDEEQ